MIETTSLRAYAKIVTAGVGMKHFPLSRLISSGNRKLPTTTAIFNMGSAHDCPALKLGLCKAYSPDGKHVCYGFKSETAMFKEVEPYRDRQKAYWLHVTAEEFASQFLLINSLKIVKWNALRINEAGDFWGQSCIAKMDRIATILKPYGITVYGYTSRSDFDYSKVKNIILSGSGFEKEGICNIFTMVEDVKKDRPKGYGVCCGDCRKCNRCMVRGKKTVNKRH